MHVGDLYLQTGIQFIDSFSFIEFITSTPGTIHFLASNWTEMPQLAHHFDEEFYVTSAMAFDEMKNTLYFHIFNKYSYPENGSIYSMDLSTEGDRNVELLYSTNDSVIMDMTFDPLARVLYWTGKHYKQPKSQIFKMAVDGRTGEPTVLLGVDGTKFPFRLAMDECHRQLYFTNMDFQQPSIERISLDGPSISQRVVEKDLVMPYAIAIDEYADRLIWGHANLSSFFSVESTKLDGTDRRAIYQGTEHTPLNVAVDETKVFWIDIKQRAVYGISKNASSDGVPQEEGLLANWPPIILIARNHLLSRQKNNPHCEHIVNEIVRSSNRSAILN